MSVVIPWFMQKYTKNIVSNSAFYRFGKAMFDYCASAHTTETKSNLVGRGKYCGFHNSFRAELFLLELRRKMSYYENFEDVAQYLFKVDK